MPVNSFLDAGFNNFLVREFPQASSSQRDLLTEEDFDSLVQGVSGNKITSGISRSKDNRLKVNWDDGILSFSDGLNDVVQIGAFDDGTSGIRIRDARGNMVTLSMLELKQGATVNPGLPNTGRLYVDNQGINGKNRLLVQFFRGAPRILATEP